MFMADLSVVIRKIIDSSLHVAIPNGDVFYIHKDLVQFVVILLFYIVVTRDAALNYNTQFATCINI